MTRIVLCRHGETERNAAGSFLSREDPPLSAHGRAQCERLAVALRAYPLDACVVSPMRRCLETRAIAVPAIPFEIDEALREVDFGQWEGATMDWLERNETEAVARRRRDPVTFRPPGGESFADVAPRIREAAERIAGRNVVVIGHRGTLGVLERLLRRLPLDSRDVTPLEPAEFRTIG